MRAIRKTLNKLQLRGLKVNMKHVKGHQNEHTYFEELLRWAQLNILADQAAKKIAGISHEWRGCKILFLSRRRMNMLAGK